MRSILATFLFSICVLLLFQSSVAANTELEDICSKWETSKLFSDWSLKECKEHPGEFVIYIKHKSTNEKAGLVFRRVIEQQKSYAKTRLYDLFYFSSSKNTHSSPELALLLDDWANWVKTIEGQKTSLPDYKKASELERTRLLKERKIELQKKLALQKRQAHLDKYGIKRLIGNKENSENLSSQKFDLMIIILLIFCMIFLLPRINKIEDAFLSSDNDWLRKYTFLPLVLIAFAFAIKSGADIDLTMLTNTANTATAGNTASEHLLGMLSMAFYNAGEYGFISYVLSSTFIFIAATILSGLTAYVLFWNKQAAFFTMLFFSAGHLINSNTADPFVPLIADSAICLIIFALVQQAFNKENSWRLLFAAPTATLAIWLEPSFIVAIFIIPIYLLVESQNKLKTFTFPITWIVILFVILFSVPPILFQARFMDFPSIQAIFLDGWKLLLEQPISPIKAIYPIPELILVFAVVGIIIHPKSVRPIIFLLTGSIIAALLASIGMAKFQSSSFLSGQCLLFSAMLAGIGLHTILEKSDAEKSPIYSVLIVLVIVGLGVLSII